MSRLFKQRKIPLRVKNKSIFNSHMVFVLVIIKKIVLGVLNSKKSDSIGLNLMWIESDVNSEFKQSLQLK